ncbi:hypothetical protein [Pyxidicoccus xibeiensis]|uniref:hypothetical protein n=1 Tax=Pyxidicoccus xibeiensis TaxID=2906759 RepID=UPI0020A7F831|nr:hypothetical protein [Pyxidicoccus xibeiensis]MCP3138905.1 hypothetical protein [Pyxidicoccus xibeiensis]
MSPSSEPSPPRRPAVGRSAALGLSGGLLLGGVGLVVAGLRGLFAAVDCAGLTGPECDLITQATREVARLQLVSGGALTALAASLFVLLRSKPTDADEDAGPSA